MSKILERAIALMLIILLTSANFLILGEYTIAYALSDEELNNQNSSTNNKNIEFNAYFEGETHSKTFEIGNENAKMYLKIAVNEIGYLETGVVELKNTNFKIKEGITNEYIQSIDIENNQIYLNKINKGTNVTIEIPIEILKNDNVSLDYFNKETIIKFTGTYIDGTGSEKSIEKEITNKLSWKGTAEAELKVEVNKYIPYSTNGNYGVILQTVVNSKVKDSSLPIKSTNIEVTVPMINNVKPTSVNVIATRTAATNGKLDGIDFSNNNYTYDVESGKVVINTSNLQDSISWIKNADDEYLITYLFEGQEIYNYASKNQINSQVITNANITVHNNEEKVISGSITTPITFEEKVGTVADFEMNALEQISKGFIYANYDTDKKEETNYYTKYIVTVNSAKLTGSIEFIQEYDKFITKDGSEGSTTIAGNNYAYNKKVEINQIEFNKILGEDGTITVKNESGETLGIINKESTLENGLYSLDISSKNNNKLSITTSAPITEGQLGINIVKAIKGNIDYSKEQMKNFEKMKVELDGKTSLDETNIKQSSEINLIEPELKAYLEIGNKNWTTVGTNENVEFKAVLDVSSEYNDLYKNPIIQIEFPDIIEKIDIKNIKLLYTDELKIGEAKLNNVNGKNILYISLQGIQTKYSIGEMVKGIHIVFNANITLKNIISSQEAQVKMYYTNSDVATYSTADNSIKESIVTIKAISQIGITAKNTMNNVRDNTSISSTEENKEELINTYSPKRTVTISGEITNTYNNPISNIVVLGRIPTEGNKKIDSEEYLGSNMSLSMQSKIVLQGIEETNYTIYYSENVNANKNLEDTSNGWTNTVNDFTKVKSYMIVINNYKMEKSSTIAFAYNAEIPENLEYNKKTYQMFKVYYDNNTDVGTLSETKESAIIGITTGEEPQLEVVLSSNFENNSEVREGQIVRFFATVRNTGNVTAENVKVVVEAPTGTSHIKYLNNGYSYQKDTVKVKNISVGDLEKGKEEQVYFDLIMTEDIGNDNEKKNIAFKVGVKSDEYETQKLSNEYNLTKTKGKINLYTTPNKAESMGLKADDVIKMITTIKLMTEETIQNVNINLTLPDGVTIQNATLSNGEEKIGNVAVENNSLNATIAELKKEHTDIKLQYEIKINEFEGKLRTILTASGDGIKTQYSNEIIHNVYKEQVEIVQTSSTPEYILEGENIEYQYVIKNTGNVLINFLTFENKIPEGLEFVSAKYEYKNTSDTISSNNNNSFKIFLYAFEKDAVCTIKLTLRAKTLYADEVKKVTNYATISVTGTNIAESNKITNYIEYDPEQHIVEEGGASTEKKYTIQGLAWEDANMNGMREDGENILSGIKVYLSNNQNGSIVKEATTNDKGEYSFNNLSKGKYLVIFLYDAAKYNITQYQAEGVNSSINSDAINSKINLDGKDTIVGITDTLNVTNQSIRNIDIGLYVSKKFDLSIEKYVSKITLNTPTIGTKTYSYNNDLAKVELLGNNLGKSSIVIEYKIVVKNEGAIDGYARKIVDYLPDNATFNSELNEEWYISDDGNAYNASLANVKLKPGESKEVTLTLTKKVNELENIYNTAEIYEAYNEQGLEDMDSTEGNNKEGEDDISTAQIIISLVTGKIVTYTILIIVIISMLGIGIYQIKKRVLNKKK